MKLLEAEILPEAFAVFYVGGEKKATLSSNIPTGVSGGNVIFTAYAENAVAANREMRVSYFRYIQERGH